MIVMQDDENRANLEEEGMAWTETDDFGVMPSGSQPLFTLESLVSKIPTPVSNVAHRALDQDLEVLSEVLVDENCWNDEYERVKEERDSFLEDVSAYKMEKERLEKTLVKIEGAMKGTTRSLVDFKRTVQHLAPEKSLSLKTNEELVSYPSLTTTSGG